MIAYCVHCGATITTEIVISNGEIAPGKYVRCPKCGKMAGGKDEHAKGNSLADLVKKKGAVSIKDGKIA